MKRALLIGGGNIGRSFIVPVFQKAGYEITILDQSKELIRELRLKKQYTITTCDHEKQRDQNIRGFKCIDPDEKESITEALISSDIIITSVGQRGLTSVIQLIADHLPRRSMNFKPHPLDIVLAENIPGGGAYCRTILMKYLPCDFPSENLPGIVETSIGKMVPFLSEEDKKSDPLRVYAESYNTLILDREGFKGELPQCDSIKLVSPIQAYVDRKLYIHNLGHAASAYLGRSIYPSAETIWEVLRDVKVLKGVRSAMRQSAAALILEYPEVFQFSDLEAHIEDLLVRFQNKTLGDSVQRVGRDLKRKLSPYDRICGAIRLAVKHQQPWDSLADVYRASLLFGRSDIADPDDQDICRMADQKGIRAVYKELSSQDDQWDREIEDQIVSS